LKINLLYDLQTLSSRARYIVALSLFGLFVNSTYAQSKSKKLQVKIQVGEYQENVPSTKSEKEVIESCIKSAKINAIENAFGETFIQGNTTYIKDSKTGTKVETNQVFNFMGESYVNGEWLEDVEPPIIKTFTSNDERWVNVRVKGKIRELDLTRVNFTAKPLSCPNISCNSESFNNGQEFYLQFKTPVKGYLAVYLDVPEDNRTYRLFPYKNNKQDSNYLFKNDEEYILFSSKLSKDVNPILVDELVLTLKDKSIPEINKLFVLFSPNEPIGKPILTKGGNIKYNTEEWKLELPDFLNSESYQKWLQTIRSQKEDIQVMTFYLSIKPRPND
jgi:hypothetical protein